MAINENKFSRLKLLLLAGGSIFFLVACGMSDDEKIKTVQENCDELEAVLLADGIKENCFHILIDTGEFLGTHSEKSVAFLAEKISNIWDAGSKIAQELRQLGTDEQTARQKAEPSEE